MKKENTAKYAHSYQDQSKQHQFVAGMALIEFAEFKPNENVFDLGCGTGELTYEISRLIQPGGVIIAIDADCDRVKLARQNKPTDIGNIDFVCVSFENHHSDLSQSFDVIFSNQVLHWIVDKKSMLKKVASLLKPDGRFVLQCVTGHPQVLMDVAEFSDELKNEVIDKYDFASREEWMQLLAEYNFVTVKQEAMQDYHFESLNDFLLWLEATTHGTFQSMQLAADSLNSLLKKYPSNINIFSNETLKICLKK